MAFIKRMLLPFFIIFFLVWDMGWWAAGVKPLFPWELQKKLQQEKGKVILIDVRTPQEYSLFKIPGAQNEPQLLMHPERVASLPKEQTIVLICFTGHRSPVVAYELQKHGFSKVYNLTWGMAGWEINRFLTQLLKLWPH